MADLSTGFYSLGMKVHRSGDPNKQKSVLRPISQSGAGKATRSALASTSDPQVIQAKVRPAPVSPTTSKLVHRRISPGNLVSRSVRVPIWAMFAVAAFFVLVPSFLMMSPGDGEESAAKPTPDESSSTVVMDDSWIDRPGLLWTEPLASTREWEDPGPSGISDREKFLLDQGVNPERWQIHYAAEDVERLQAELEAIQRNSALLRSLTRQQSGDLSLAYSSLEATQEQKDGALEDLQQRIDELEGRIQLVDELARELRGVLGLPEPEGGVGGPVGAMTQARKDDIDPWLLLRADIVAIEQRAGTLVFDLDEVNTEIQLRLVKLQQTGLPRGSNVIDDLQFYDAMPVGWPVDGPVTSRFGLRSSPFRAGTEMHTGIDIAVPSGTPVRATGSGTVRIAGSNGGYGLLVVIDHGRGVSTWYGHNSRIRVSPGQRVNGGDTVAEVGSTGASTGPHVHYEVRFNNAPQDPLSLMQMER